MNRRKSTSFYVEALLLTLFFLCITAILIHMFAAARQESILARSLTQSQQIAQNISASFYGTDSAQDFWQQLNMDSSNQTPALVTVNANGEPDPNGEYIVSLFIDTLPAENGWGNMERLSLSITYEADQTVLFSNEFLRYLPQ